jgi:ATP-dependent Lhr-like helicase
MFQARWRWNLNRSLMVLRFRGGRRNPPPIQRMESDDLLAAVFPQAAACQDNVTGPLEIPDHVLVRQTIDDSLHEALDVDGVIEVVRGMESGRIRVHCCDTTEASVLAHEIVTARPYAFLDDEEFQNRRTNAVQLRRGLSVDLASVGTLDPAAIDSVHAEIQPAPETPDELHDLLSALVVTRPRPEWQALFDRLLQSGRAVCASAPGGGVAIWAVAEHAGLIGAGFESDDGAVVAAVRGHLEVSGIVTGADLASMTALPAGRVAYALEALRHEGFAFSDRYTPGATGPEWVARRLLARMHAYSRRTRRQRVEPATAQDFMRFLLAWQHVSPGARLSGPGGLVTVLDQLQGFEAAAVAWEPEILSRRLEHYRSGWLDELCHAGEAAWLRLAPRARDDADAPLSAPSKATPIALVYRAHLGWLLAGARAGAAPACPEVGATAEIVEVLSERGACFATDLVAATRRLPDDIERALWDGVSRGLIMCDGFAAIRARVAGTRAAVRSHRFSHAARLATATAPSAGRWSLVPTGAAAAGSDGSDGLDGHDLAEAVAEQLLQRWGVVFRDLAGRDSFRLPWRELQWALRRLEDRGLVRGGRFVSGFSGEQYALPAAADQLARIRRQPKTGEAVVVNATDPLNLVGLVVPGQTVQAVRTKRVTYIDGVPTGAE